jgi:hypothetical protein
MTFATMKQSAQGLEAKPHQEGFPPRVSRSIVPSIDPHFLVDKLNNWPEVFASEFEHVSSLKINHAKNRDAAVVVVVVVLRMEAMLSLHHRNPHPPIDGSASGGRPYGRVH